MTEDEFDEGSRHVVPPPSPASAAFRPQVEKAREFLSFFHVSPCVSFNFFCLFCHIHTANIANTAQCAISQGVKYIVVSGGVCSSLGKALAFCGLIILIID